MIGENLFSFEALTFLHRCLFHEVQNDTGPTQRLQCVQGSFVLALKRPGSEAVHSFPSRAKVKNGGATPPFPRITSFPLPLIFLKSNRDTANSNFVRSQIKIDINAKKTAVCYLLRRMGHSETCDQFQIKIHIKQGF
jgi:hypothetical protein